MRGKWDTCLTNIMAARDLLRYVASHCKHLPIEYVLDHLSPHRGNREIPNIEIPFIFGCECVYRPEQRLPKEPFSIKK